MSVESENDASVVMEHLENLARLIAARKNASDAMDSYVERNASPANSEMLEYVRLAYEYVSATDAVMEAYAFRQLTGDTNGDHQSANDDSLFELSSHPLNESG